MSKLAAWILDYLWVAKRQASELLSPRRRRVPSRYIDGEWEPIVLLPGVYESWQFLRSIADRLNHGGHPVYVVAALGYNRLTIPQSAALVTRFLANRNLRRVILVAHSKGGLIGKHVMTINDGAGRVKHLVAVNTPFSGSDYARFVPLRTVKAFVPSEPTIAMLSKRNERNASITSIYSTFDPHIPGGSALEGAHNVKLPLMGHFRPLGQHLLIDAVEDAVERNSRQT